MTEILHTNSIKRMHLLWREQDLCSLILLSVSVSTDNSSALYGLSGYKTEIQ